MIKIPSFIKIGTGVQAILRFSSAVWKAIMLVLLMDKLFKSAIEVGWKWRDIHAKFRDDRFRHLSNITVVTARIWHYWSKGLVDMALKWHSVAWYSCQVSWRLMQAFKQY
jgi:hypothetical protein